LCGAQSAAIRKQSQDFDAAPGNAAGRGAPAQKNMSSTLANGSSATQSSSHNKGAALTLAALGVVYGDIGTSPLYAFKETLAPGHGLAITPDSVLGVLSLIFWALMVVISLKYVVLVMRADNQGEGGILSLLALAARGYASDSRRRAALMVLALIGAAMFYGDSMVTPAISVLSAVEGVKVAAPAFGHWVIPITLGIILCLFMLQSQGTARIGRLFGPVMLLWFTVLGVAGVAQIIANPQVLAALNPSYGISFLLADPLKGFLVGGSVFLAVTGGEALYADMGHFGARPIRLAWFTVVLPGLALNYFGQGALVLAHPAAIANPFFLTFPDWARIPMVVLAGAAAVIASQATISGAFSLTAQAVQLGYCPRLRITHTSESERGQIYVPFINWMVFVIVILLVLGFHTSDNLAAAYGIAVALTMGVTTLMCAVVARRLWKWSALTVAAVFAPLALIDVCFVSANAIKIPSGGWFPILAGGVLYMLFVTWKRGREIVAEATRTNSFPLEEFIRSMEDYPPHRVAGTAVFMASDTSTVPHALLHNLKHNKVLHEQVVFFTIHTEEVPRVPLNERIKVDNLGFGCYRVTARLGFMEEPDAEALLMRCGATGLEFEPMLTSYFLSRDAIIPTEMPGMAIWREHLFAWMVKNAARATDFFKVPANRVVELGTQVEI
jgi:KUP system potassium uptake protein